VIFNFSASKSHIFSICYLSFNKTSKHQNLKKQAAVAASEPRLRPPSRSVLRSGSPEVVRVLDVAFERAPAADGIPASALQMLVKNRTGTDLQLTLIAPRIDLRRTLSASLFNKTTDENR
jgi:hypothetical protein